MLVLMQNAAEAVTATNGESGEPVRPVIGAGGRALAMP